MAELIQFQLSKDANRLASGDVLFPSKYVNAYVLASAVAQTINVPTGARVVVFNATNNFYVNFQTTAAEPTVDITDGSGPELNPVARDVTGYTSFSIMAPEVCIVTLAYFN